MINHDQSTVHGWAPPRSRAIIARAAVIPVHLSLSACTGGAGSSASEPATSGASLEPTSGASLERRKHG